MKIPIKGYEWLYSIDKLWSVYSEWKFRATNYILTWVSKRWVCWKKLTLNKQKEGYLTVMLYKDKKSKIYRVHRLMWYMFLWLDITDTTMFVCHKNDVTSDNRLENLFLWTNSDNIKDHWSKHPEKHLHKLSPIDIRNIRESNLTKKELSKQYNVALVTIYRYAQTWQNV